MGIVLFLFIYFLFEIESLEGLCLFRRITGFDGTDWDVSKSTKIKYSIQKCPKKNMDIQLISEMFYKIYHKNLMWGHPIGSRNSNGSNTHKIFFPFFPFLINGGTLIRGN